MASVENKLLEISSRSDIYIAFEAVEFLTSFRLSKKSNCRYVTQLFGIPEVAKRVAEWTCPGTPLFNRNVVQFARDFYNESFIRFVEKCRENQFPQVDDSSADPAYSQETYKLMRFFHEKGVNLTPVKKGVIELFTVLKRDFTNYSSTRRIKKVVREMIRFFCDTGMITKEDRVKIIATFGQVVGDKNWRRSKRNKNFPRLDAELIQLYQYAIQHEPKVTGGKIIDLLQRNVLVNFFVALDTKFVKLLVDNKHIEDRAIYDLAITCLQRLRYCDTKDLKELTAKLLSMPSMKGNSNLKNSLESTSTGICYRICKLKLHEENLTDEYFELFKPALESWVLGPVFSTKAEIEVIMSIDIFPTDIITHLLGFMSNKFVKGFSLTCKKFNELIKKNSLIWQDKFKKYFPLDIRTNEQTNEICFRTKYLEKFKMKTERSLFGEKLGFRSVEVDKNSLIWNSGPKIGVYDLETSEHKHHTIDNTRSFLVRSFNDTLFVRNDGGELALYSKYDFKEEGSFDNLPQKGSNLNFAVNEKWLIGSHVIYDYQQGSVVQTLEKIFQHCIIRNNMCYGLTGSQVRVIDPRQAKVVDVIELSAGSNVKINVYDSTLYAVSNVIEVLDIRQLNQRRKTDLQLPFPGCCAIDLVSNNIWTPHCVWDLTDLSWHQHERLPNGVLDTRLLVCNGKSFVYSGGYDMRQVSVAGTQYFPYSDFRL